MNPSCHLLAECVFDAAAAHRGWYGLAQVTRSDISQLGEEMRGRARVELDSEPAEIQGPRLKSSKRPILSMDWFCESFPVLSWQAMT
jgi:hypothetical protein